MSQASSGRATCEVAIALAASVIASSVGVDLEVDVRPAAGVAGREDRREGHQALGVGDLHAAQVGLVLDALGVHRVAALRVAMPGVDGDVLERDVVVRHVGDGESECQRHAVGRGAAVDAASGCRCARSRSARARRDRWSRRPGRGRRSRRGSRRRVRQWRWWPGTPTRRTRRGAGGRRRGPAGRWRWAACGKCRRTRRQSDEAQHARRLIRVRMSKRRPGRPPPRRRGEQAALVGGPLRGLQGFGHATHDRLLKEESDIDRDPASDAHR